MWHFVQCKQLSPTQTQYAMEILKVPQNHRNIRVHGNLRSIRYLAYSDDSFQENAARRLRRASTLVDRLSFDTIKWLKELVIDDLYDGCNGKKIPKSLNDKDRDTIHLLKQCYLLERDTVGRYYIRQDGRTKETFLQCFEQTHDRYAARALMY